MCEYKNCANCKFATNMGGGKCFCENRKSEKWFEITDATEDCCEEYEEVLS